MVSPGESGARGERLGGLTTFVMTAGLSSDDYRFLGRAPREAFWRRYAELTSFERPTAIVLSAGDSFRAYLSGIRSARRDRTKTPLRYTLVFEGPCRSEGAVLAVKALAALVDDLGDPKATSLTVGSLGRALDAQLPESFVEAALAELRVGPPSDGEGPASGGSSPASGRIGPLAEVEDRARRALESLSEDVPAERSDLRFFWGGRASAAARAQLVGFADRLLRDGESGAALVVNLASKEHLDALGGAESACAVLFAGEGGEETFSQPLEWPPKKGRPGSPRGLPRAIDLRREAQAEPGFSTRLGHLLITAWRTLRDWLLSTPGSS